MKQDSQNWAELQRLFALADAAAPADRDRVLAEACPDPALRDRVLALLRAAEREPESAAGVPIGPYTLLKLIGSGGVGAVYLAERPLAGSMQQVALKVLAPHAAGRGFAERFQREQQILAALDHPNITRLLDAGVGDSGQAYLVTEYIEGQHLDAYCDANKLSVDRRLALFEQVCAAVGYAHRNLIIHLDLKPSNILVTAEENVKLLDFGTAKLIQPDGSFTATIMATPAYASPEQLRHEALTTASDIYSLGVILYELLTGERPDREHPATPRTFPADLSTVILKCLAEAPSERYASVDALAADVARYRDGRAILAHPQTTLYQVTKFLKRNRGKVAVTLLLVITLATTLLYAWLQQSRALREAQRAERVNAFLNDVLGAADPGWQSTMRKKGASLTFLDVVEEMRSRIGVQFARDPEGEIRLRRTIARTFSQLGKLREAREQLDLALKRQLSIAPADHPDAGILYKDLAGELYQERAGAEARKNAVEAVRILTTHPRPQDKRDLMEAYEFLGLTNFDAGTPFSEVETPILKAIAISRELYGNGGATSTGLSALATLSILKGRFVEGERYLNEAISIERAAPGAKGASFANMLRDAGNLCIEKKDYACAIRNEREALDLLVATSAAENAYTLEAKVALDLATGMNGSHAAAIADLQALTKIVAPPSPFQGFILIIDDALGQVHMAAGQPRDAEPEFRAAYAYARAHRKQPTRNAVLESRLGECLASVGKKEEAQPLLREAYETLLAALGPDHPWTKDAKSRAEK